MINGTLVNSSSNKKQMKALLVSPHKLIPVSFSITLKASPPIGLAYIAGALENQGYDVEVFDCVAEAPENYFKFIDNEDISAQGIDIDQMLSSLGDHYDLIGLSMMFSNNWLINRYLANLLKKKYPKAVIVAGGEHASAIPEYCLQDCEGLDVVVVGEGEETISEIAILLKEGNPYSDASGIAYKNRENNNEIVTAPRRKRIKEINAIVEPAWHLFPLDKYFSNNISFGVTSDGNSLPIFATRGCPYSCTFCSSPLMWGTKYTMRDVDDVIREIKKLNTLYGVTNIDFYDLTAIIKKQWILDFCQAIKDNGLKITWQIPAGTRAEAIDFEVAQALNEAGCKNITYAPESGSIRVLKEIKKKVSLPKMLDSIGSSHTAGLNVKLNIMMGYPNETVSDVLKTAFFLMKASYYGATDASPSVFNPYPGSALFQELYDNKELTLSDEYFKTIVYSQSLHGFVNYNRNMSKRGMIFLLFICYLAFYSSNYLFRPIRVLRLLINVSTRKYETRGEYMLGEILKRNKGMKTAKKVAPVETPLPQ